MKYFKAFVTGVLEFVAKSGNGKETVTFPCGNNSPCSCTNSTEDPGITVVNSCPVKDSFLVIPGIEATRVKLVSVIMANYVHARMNISIINNTMESIVDFYGISAEGRDNTDPYSGWQLKQQITTNEDAL